MAITLTVNGQPRTLDVEPDMPLLWAVRETLGLTGTKFGCGIAACGACTVHLNGRAVRSCTLPVSSADGGSVTTIEGLAGGDTLNAVQQAWVTHQVPQCGYCQSGMIMAVTALLAEHPQPDRSGDRRRHHQYLPMRHVRARAACHSRRSPKELEGPTMRKWTRRAFIGTGTLVGGGFVLGVAGVALLPQPSQRARRRRGATRSSSRPGS